MPRALRIAVAPAAAVGGLVVVLLCLLAGYGWLYALRAGGWLKAGPSVSDSLPLLQLAGFDGQPMLRVIVAWLVAGVIAGVVLVRIRPWVRAALTGPLALGLLLIASQAAYATTRNVRFATVLTGRRPGFGPVLEALAFAGGCLLPRRVGAARSAPPGS